MTAPKIKVTYSLDPETVKTLDRLARIWKTSKSGALRRALDVAAASEPETSRAASTQRRGAATNAQLGALRELQDSMALSQADAQAWVQQVREARRAWPDRHAR